jgi:hypothetical protein
VTREPNAEKQSAVLVLLVATVGGLLAVLLSLVAFNILVSGQATRQAVLSRVGSYMLWTQPFIYIMAGLLAGARDSRWGPLRAPVIGLFLASMGWLLLTRQNMLPTEVNIVAYLLTAGALFALVGAMIAPLIKEHVGKAVTLIVALGMVAFVWSFLNLGSISGEVQREVIERAQGTTTAMKTVGVPGADVALVDTESGDILYTARTGSSGRYHISGVPIGEYTLKAWDPASPTVRTQIVQVDRSITGGTPWKAVSMPGQVRESGRIFD